MSKEIIIPTLRTFPGSEMFSFENRYEYDFARESIRRIIKPSVDSSRNL